MRRTKSRFTKTDVNAIFNLSNELVRYKLGYKLMANMIINIETRKEIPQIFLDYFPEDEYSRLVVKKIEEWGKKLYGTDGR